MKNRKRNWQVIVPALLVISVLVFAPLSSMQASVRLEKPIGDRSPNGTQVRADSNYWLVAAVAGVVLVTAVATTTTDLAVAAEVTVFTEVAARTTGELGEPIPVFAMSPQQRQQIAHQEFDR